MQRKSRPIFLGLMAGLWLALIVLGTWRVLAYSYSPGVSISSERMWPSGTKLRHSETASTLILAVHPHCPCTRATLGELAIIVTRCRRGLTTQILCYRPSASAATWSDTELIKSAREIPGVTIVDDPGGMEARRFGASTSGETLLYSPKGRLLFKGGITVSRGHSGDNLGRDAIIDFLTTGEARITKTPVFGCSLRGLS